MYIFNYFHSSLSIKWNKRFIKFVRYLNKVERKKDRNKIKTELQLTNTIWQCLWIYPIYIYRFICIKYAGCEKKSCKWITTFFIRKNFGLSLKTHANDIHSFKLEYFLSCIFIHKIHSFQFTLKFIGMITSQSSTSLLLLGQTKNQVKLENFYKQFLVTVIQSFYNLLLNYYFFC